MHAQNQDRIELRAITHLESRRQRGLGAGDHEHLRHQQPAILENGGAKMRWNNCFAWPAPHSIRQRCRVADKMRGVITQEDCFMATNRSQRLRKKLCVDEFQELGFELNLDFKEDLADEAIDAFLDAFLKEAMEANGLGYVGGDDYGLVCLQKRGSVSEEQRAAVEAWLKGRSELTEVTVSPLLDVWYPEKPINPVA